MFCFFSALSQTAKSIEEDKIRTYIETVKKDYNYPGIVVAISDENGVMFLESFGNVSTKDQFQIGSLSKSFTGLLILKLSERGLLNLDDPVVKHLDWFEYENEEISDKITIKNLLYQTSGLTTNMGRNFLKENSKNIRENLAHQLKRLKLETPPNNLFEYSNLNYQLLGYIIEEVTKDSYGNVLKEEITDPFSMASTTGFVTSHFVQGYQYFLYFPIIPIKPNYHKDNIPVGYISSTASDMGQYLTKLMNSYNGIENTVINQKTSIALFEPNPLNNRNYAMGWFNGTHSKYKTFGHTGGTQSFSTTMVIIPEINRNIIVLTNVFSDPTSIGRGILDILLNEKPSEKSKVLFYIIRSLPILVFLLTCIFVITLRKWFRMKKPIFANNKILPNILLVFGLILGIIWITVIPVLNGAALKTIVEFDKSTGYSLIFLSILTILVSLLSYFIRAKK